MSEHNRGLVCTESLGCLCPKHCQCQACIFTRRSNSLYNGLVSRLRQKKWKSGKREGEIRVEKRELPFSRQQFRAWLTVVLEDTPSCLYCQMPISITTISPDHYKPISRGGSLALANLRQCCVRCNQIKGSMLAGEYLALRKFVGTLTEDGQKEIWKRLLGGMRHSFGKPKEKSAVAIVPQKTPPQTVIAYPAVMVK